MSRVIPISDDEIIELASKHAPLVAALWDSRGNANHHRVDWDGGFNYCQIQRDPFISDSVSDRKRKLIEHLRQIEYVVLYGERDLSIDGIQPRAYSGGLRDIKAFPADAQLLFMRGPVEIVRDDTWQNRVDCVKDEFLSEFTVAPRVREAVAA